MTESCTNAIIKAFSEKKITSTTILANGYYFDRAIKLIFVNNLQYKVGVHLNLTYGEPLTENIKRDRFFCDETGIFHGKINKNKSLSNLQKELVFNELTAQIKRVRDAGVPITHCDSHHHIHTAPNITAITIKVLKASNIKKIRISRNIGNIPFTKKLIKDLYNKFLLSKGFTSTSLFGSIEDVESNILLKSSKSLEIMVHPDFSNNKLIDRMGYDEDSNPIGKEINLQTDFLYKYYLCSFYDLKKEEQT